MSWCLWTSSVQDLDLSWLRILMPLFRPFMTDSDESRWTHVTCKSSPAVVQATLSSVKLRLSLCEGDCLCASRNETDVIISVCYVSVSLFVKLTCMLFELVVHTCARSFLYTHEHAACCTHMRTQFLLLVCRHFLQPNRIFTFEVYSDVRDGFVSRSHEHRDTVSTWRNMSTVVSVVAG